MESDVLQSKSPEDTTYDATFVPVSPINRGEGGVSESPGGGSIGIRSGKPEFSQRETVDEDAVAEILGISKTDLRKLRKEKLSEGTDYIRTSKRISYHETGISAISQILKLEKEKKGADDVAAELAADRVILTVVRRVPNPRLLMCRDDSGAIVRLRVRDASRFVVGSMIPNCRRIGADFYEYTGRAPAWRGQKLIPQSV